MLLKQVLRLDYPFFELNSVSDVVTIIQTDDIVEHAFLILPNLISLVVRLSFTTYLMVKVDAELGLFFLMSTIVINFGVRIPLQKYEARKRRVQYKVFSMVRPF